MAEPEQTIDNLNRTLQGSINDIIESLQQTRVNPGKEYEARKEEARVLEKLGEDLKNFGDFSEGMDETVKEFEKIIKEFKRSVERQEKQKNVSGGDLSNRITEAQKINSKLDSVRKMNAYLGTQKKWHDAQIGVLKEILNCCLKGSSLSTSTSESTKPSVTVEPKERSDDDSRFLEGLKREKRGEKIDFKSFLDFGSDGTTFRKLLVGDNNIVKGIAKSFKDVASELMVVGEYQSLLSKVTKNTLEYQLKYEQSIRQALYETAGATSESKELFKTMSDLGNTVAITGFEQKKTLDSIVKLSRMGIRYDGDSEKYKKRILALSTTTLNTEKQLGLEAGSLSDEFANFYRYGVLNQNAIANLGRGMQEVARTTGISGEQFKKVLGATQGIVDAMRKASTLTASAAKNIYELGANAEKFGVADEFSNISKAASSTVNLFKEASDGTKLLVMNAANAVGRLGDLQAGTLLKSKEGIKDLAKGVNQVFRQFGIESADAIDTLSDESKMRLNLVLSSAFNLELGQVKGVLKTLDAAGKTLADKLLDLDKQLAKNISLEKRTALLEEQRKLKSESSLNILSVLSESAETAKTMDEAFSRFGQRRKEFESDLQALGLGGSNKNVIREAINQSLTSVNAALSKSGLKEISFSAEEMTKALQDPQAFQDLLGKLDAAQQKSRATGNAQLDALTKTNNALDNLTAVVQDTIAKPLNALLSYGGISGIVATNVAMLLGPSIATSLGGVLGKVLNSLKLKGTTTGTSSPDVGGGGSTGVPPTGGESISWGKLFKNNVSGMFDWAKSWAKFAGNLAMAGVIVYGGYLLLKNFMPDVSMKDLENMGMKVAMLGIVAAAGATLMGEIYLASLVVQKYQELKISWESFAKGALILGAAALVLPPFIMGISWLSSKALELLGGANLDEMANTTAGLASVMVEGAKFMVGLAVGLGAIAGVGAFFTGPQAVVGLGVLAAGAGILAVAALSMPVFLKGLSLLAESSLSMMGDPKKITKSYEKLIEIMEPAAKLIGYVALIGAALAGMSVAGIGGAVIGGISYAVGWLGSKIFGGPNFGDVNEAIKSVIERSISTLKVTVDSINQETSNLTPATVQAALNKLESFGNAQELLGKVLTFYASKFQNVLPAYIKIARLSNNLRYTGSTSPEEIGNKLKSLTNIINGIALIIPELAVANTTLDENQLNTFTKFMETFSKTALPLFKSLASIDQVVRSESFKTVASSQATFDSASKVLENVSPYLRSIMYNIQYVTKTLYEGLAGTPIEQLKEGADVSVEIINLFSLFVESVKKSGKNLQPKDMDEFEKVFGNPKTINSLRNVLQTTGNLVDIFGKETRSSLDLKYIASNMKSYGDFYGAIAELLKSYDEIQKTVDPKKVMNTVGGYSRSSVNTYVENLKTNFDDKAKTRLEQNLIGAFNLVNAFIGAATRPEYVSNLSKVADASANLNDLSEATKNLGSFLQEFDANILSKLNQFGETLSTVSYVRKELGGKEATLKSLSAISLIIQDTFSIVNEMIKVFSEKTAVLNAGNIDAISRQIFNVSGSINSLLESITKIGDPTAINKLQLIANSLPSKKPENLKEKFDNLKLYIDEISRITNADLMQSIMSLGKIKGISIESNTESAIKMVTSLTNFITAIQSGFGKLKIEQSQKDAKELGQYATNKTQSPISEQNLNNIKEFLEKQAIPAIEKIEAISTKLAGMPINETIVQTAAKKLEAFGGMTNSINSFYEGLNLFTRKWTTLKDTGLKEFKPSDLAKKTFGTVAQTDEALDKHLRELEKTQGYNPEHWILTEYKESDLAVMSRMFDETSTEGKETKKLFETIGKIPKFYAENILSPFLKGGGASLSVGGINFVSQSLEGISRILENFLGEKGVLKTLQKHKNVIDKINPASLSQLESATKILDGFKQNNLFEKFVASLLEGLIFPVLVASQMTGGPANLENARKSADAFSGIIKIVPELLKNVTVELGKIGDIKDANSIISNAKAQLDKTKNNLPQLLDSLTTNIVIPVLENLLPTAFMDQALKRLTSASDLVNKLNGFVSIFKNIDTSLTGTFGQITFVSSVGSLMNAIDPVEGNLSTFADKLIMVKDSLQSIADSINSIIGMTVQGNIIDVLNKIGQIPTSGINAINNVGNNLAKVNLDNFENIKNKLQLEVMPNKNSPENENLDKLNEKETKNLENQNTMINVLNNIHNALVSAGIMKETGSVGISSTGKLGVEKVTGTGSASTGNVLASSAVAANNISPTV